MHKQNGFTVIELLIAFAIAGLILLVVFLAVPAVQRSTRNTARHKDAAVLLSTVFDYRTQASNGALPESCDSAQAACFIQQVPLAFYQSKGTTPDITFQRLDQPYAEAVTHLTPDTEDVTEKVMIFNYAICNDQDNMPTGQYASLQSVVVQYAIETRRGPAMQCEMI